MPLFSKRLAKVSYPFSVIGNRYSGRSLNVSTLGGVTSTTKGQYSTDGTKLLVLGVTSGMHDYSLSTAWDITTASYNGKYDPLIIYRDAHWKPDGTSFFIIEDIGSSLCHLRRYDCSTAWQTSSGVTLGATSPDFFSDINNPAGLFIDPTGTKIFITDLTTDDITYYTMTAWDPTSMSSQVSTFALSTWTGAPNDVYFKPDGDRMFIMDVNTKGYLYFDLSTAWDITTASYVGDLVMDDPSATGVNGMTTSADGRWLLAAARASESIIMYEL